MHPKGGLPSPDFANCSSNCTPPFPCIVIIFFLQHAFGRPRGNRHIFGLRVLGYKENDRGRKTSQSPAACERLRLAVARTTALKRNVPYSKHRARSSGTMKGSSERTAQQGLRDNDARSRNAGLDIGCGNPPAVRGNPRVSTRASALPLAIENPPGQRASADPKRLARGQYALISYGRFVTPWLMVERFEAFRGRDTGLCVARSCSTSTARLNNGRLSETVLGDLVAKRRKFHPQRAGGRRLVAPRR